MIICIGREFGSGGHEIGKLLAEKLSLTLYNQEIVTSAVKRCGDIDASELEKADEKKTNPWIHSIWYGTKEKELRGLSANDISFGLQSKVILEAAQKGDCVFIGRCADYILKEADIERISIFITAPFSIRADRKMKQLSISEKAASALVRKTDKQRKSYYDYYTGGSWGKPYNYDFCINSCTKGIEQTAEEITSFIRILE